MEQQENQQPEMKPLVSNEFIQSNLVYDTIAHLVRDLVTLMVSFVSITKYFKVEQVTLTRAMQPLWDLYHDFRTAKNANACLMHLIETKLGVTNDLMKQQGKITPSDAAMALIKDVETFGQFINVLTDEQLQYLELIAKEWLDKGYNGECTFDAFFVNGTNGVEFQNGDYILGYDTVYAQPVATKVISAAPGGFITCADNQGTFTLSKHINPRKAMREEIPQEVRDILDETTSTFVKFVVDDKDAVKKGQDQREGKKAELAKKAADKKAKADKLEEAKKKANLDNEAKFNELQAIQLNSKEIIEAAVKMLNNSGLDKDRVKQVRDRIKAAKEALKAKKVEEPKATEEQAPTAEETLQLAKDAMAETPAENVEAPVLEPTLETAQAETEVATAPVLTKAERRAKAKADKKK